MDYYFNSQQRVPIYNIFNSKFQNEIELNKSNNNYTNRVNHKNVKSYRKEIFQGEKKKLKNIKLQKIPLFKVWKIQI